MSDQIKLGVATLDSQKPTPQEQDAQKRRIDKIWRNKLIATGCFVSVVVILLYWFIKEPFIAAIASGLTVGITAFLVLFIPSDNLGETAGYFFGIATFVLIWLGKSGHYIWLTVSFVLVLVIIIGFYLLAQGVYKVKRS